MISVANMQDIPHLTKLWKEAFGEEEYAKKFYAKAFTHHESEVMVIVEREPDMEIVSMLHYISCCLERGGRKYNGAYLYALATDKKYRGKGIMRKLIEYAKTTAMKQQLDFLYLIPAKDSLYDYYKKQGFYAVYSVDVLQEVSKMYGGTVHQVTCERFKELIQMPWKKTNETMRFSVLMTEYAIEELFLEEDFRAYEVSNNENIIAYYAEKDGQVCFYGMNEDIVSSRVKSERKKNGCIFFCGDEKESDMDMEIVGYVPY